MIKELFDFTSQDSEKNGTLVPPPVPSPPPIIDEPSPFQFPSKSNHNNNSGPNNTSSATNNINNNNANNSNNQSINSNNAANANASQQQNRNDDRYHDDRPITRKYFKNCIEIRKKNSKDIENWIFPQVIVIHVGIIKIEIMVSMDQIVINKINIVRIMEDRIMNDI